MRVLIYMLRVSSWRNSVVIASGFQIATKVGYFKDVANSAVYARTYIHATRIIGYFSFACINVETQHVCCPSGGELLNTSTHTQSHTHTPAHAHNHDKHTPFHAHASINLDLKREVVVRTKGTNNNHSH